MVTLEQQEVFWSDRYRGRPIAIYNCGGRWHVYLDHVLQHNMVFATGEHAARWLRRRIDADWVSAPAACETALAA